MRYSFATAGSKRNSKKKLMTLKAFWFIAWSFWRIPLRQNVKENGGSSRAQSLKVCGPWTSCIRFKGLNRENLYLSDRFLNSTSDTQGRHLWQLDTRTHISIISLYAALPFNLITALPFIYSVPQFRKITAILDAFLFLPPLTSSHVYNNFILPTNVFKSLFLSFSPPLSLVPYYLPLFFSFSCLFYP